MVIRFPLQSQAVYSELLESLQVARMEGLGAKRGSLKRREVKGNAYWYLRRRIGDRIDEKYLGPETDELLERIESLERDAEQAKEAAQRRRRLIRMLRSAGYPTTDRRTGKILEELAAAGVFRLEGVLVGTHAFRTYSALLGARFDETLAFTNDLDIAQDRSVRLAITDDADPDLGEALTRAENFLSIPALDPRSPTTSFRSEDHEIRVDVLTPLRGREGAGAIELPMLGVHATPLRFLDYLLEETQPAAVLSGSGILVHVPSPERFALHKLIVSLRRDRAFADKSRKDLAQAGVLIEVLLDDRPEDVADAWEELVGRGRGWERPALAGGRRLRGDLWNRFLAAVG